jgi:flagellum-specific ATP synthase
LGILSLYLQETERLKSLLPFRVYGVVRDVVGLVIEAEGLSAPVGALCRILDSCGKMRAEAEVVGFRGTRTLLLSLGNNRGIERQDKIELVSRVQAVSVGRSLQGRVLNARGEAIDGKGPLHLPHRWPLYREPVSPLSRPRIDKGFDTGIRSIYDFLTC